MNAKKYCTVFIVKPWSSILDLWSAETTITTKVNNKLQISFVKTCLNEWLLSVTNYNQEQTIMDL